MTVSDVEFAEFVTLPRLLAVKDVASVIRCSKAKVYDLHYSRAIPTMRVAGRIAMYAAHVNAYVDAGPRTVPSISPAVLDGQKEDRLIYIMESGDHVKIGHSKEPTARLKTIQESSAYEMRLLATCRGGRKSEEEIHSILWRYRARGEWFRISKPDLRWIIADMAVWGGWRAA